MAINKALPAAFYPIASHRNEPHYNFLPGKLRANAPAPKVKNPIVLEADAVVLDLNWSEWLSNDELKPIHPVNPDSPDPSLERSFQIPAYLRQTFLEAYRCQADPRSGLSSKGEWVNLTA